MQYLMMRLLGRHLQLNIGGEGIIPDTNLARHMYQMESLQKAQAATGKMAVAGDQMDVSSLSDNPNLYKPENAADFLVNAGADAKDPRIGKLRDDIKHGRYTQAATEARELLQEQKGKLAADIKDVNLAGEVHDLLPKLQKATDELDQAQQAYQRAKTAHDANPYDPDISARFKAQDQDYRVAVGNQQRIQAQITDIGNLRRLGEEMAAVPAPPQDLSWQNGLPNDAQAQQPPIIMPDMGKDDVIELKIPDEIKETGYEIKVPDDLPKLKTWSEATGLPQAPPQVKP